ncbi:flagellar export chaperone FliS [Sporolactobacillus sp. CPB3-1]|uniref:Flagellar secretion chaperone FliS n=1 Tax=Sporolactobacillus mangiferae TaxID=2940498 RepID=A0ABT0MBN8_9BACL|nr:flagellar export chaperone FliS [Sporolactobacillus mangiferae]MCL1632279.1 flagellar export chaperone FliS [Sporolactobacillus mangiferae]
MPLSPYKAYKQNSVMTATPGELTLMLYNGCIRFIRQAGKTLHEKDYKGKNMNLQKAQAIIRELMVTLDMNQPIAKNMMQLYDYMNRRLIEANIKNDPSILDEVEKLVTDMRDAWKQAVENVKKAQPKRDRI